MTDCSYEHALNWKVTTRGSLYVGIWHLIMQLIKQISFTN